MYCIFLDTQFPGMRSDRLVAADWYTYHLGSACNDKRGNEETYLEEN